MSIHLFVFVIAVGSVVGAYLSAKPEDKVRVLVQCLIGIFSAAVCVVMAWRTNKAVWHAAGFVLVLAAGSRWFGTRIEKILK